MTAMMRQICKQILTIAVLGVAFFCALSLSLPLRAGAEGLVTRIVTDPLTGVAIDGFDPVTYFTDAEPQPGSPDFEYYWKGVPWYFASAANRDVFKRTPEVYAPRYGGHGTMSLARGYLSDGNPRIYAVVNQRLYLFYSTGNREAFLLAKVQSLTAAEANWAVLSKDLLGE